MTLETQYKNFKIANPDSTWTFEEWKEDFSKELESKVNKLAKEMNKEKEVVCPNCGEKENFHFNYDYGKVNFPIEDVLCNECGHFFKYI